MSPLAYWSIFGTQACCVFHEPRPDLGRRTTGEVTNWPKVHDQDYLYVVRSLSRSDLGKLKCLRAVVVQKLIDDGADVEDTAKRDTLPLVLASRSGLAPVVSTAGASVTARDSSGHKALLAAQDPEGDFSKPRLDTIQYLLETCCDVREAAEHGGESVLHAIGRFLGNYMFGGDDWNDALLRLLLERGADAQEPEYCRVSAIYFFCVSRSWTLGWSVFKMLI